MCQDAQCLKPLKQPLLSSCKFPLLWLTLQPLSFAFLTCSHTFLAGFQHFNFFSFFFLFFATESHGVHTWWESFWLENMLC
uniref:Putative secreted protein n=1 Tax=Rhipicephalus microplus TaxID=6941 RepID=A0A6M2DE96_RHIMP